MIRKMFVGCFLVIFAPASAVKPCPTCPKGYAISTVEQALLAKQPQKQLNPNIPLQNVWSPQLGTKNRAHETPVEIVASRTDHFKKESPPKQTVDMFGLPTRGKEEIYRLNQENVKNKEIKALQEYMANKALKRKR